MDDCLAKCDKYIYYSQLLTRTLVSCCSANTGVDHIDPCYTTNPDTPLKQWNACLCDVFLFEGTVQVLGM